MIAKFTSAQETLARHLKPGDSLQQIKDVVKDKYKLLQDMDPNFFVHKHFLDNYIGGIIEGLFASDFLSMLPDNERHVSFVEASYV